MSITITVRPNGTTTGGTKQEIPGEGEIDTKAEAEAALSLLPEGSTNTVVVGDKAFTRAQLIELRDRLNTPASPAAPATPADPAAPAATAVAAETVAADGVSHGFYIKGKYAGGLGNKGHSGGDVGLGYVPGITVVNGTGMRFYVDPSIGFTAGHGSSSYTTPGGEAISSAYTNYGASIGVSGRLVPNILDRRLHISAGPTIGIGGFSTADTTTVSTPANCTPGDFGRSECEPSAGPRTGNAGTTGLMNFDLGAARGTSGLFVNPGLDITLGVDIVRGDWGGIQGTGSFDLGQMILSPSDGHGFSFTQVGGALGIRGNFGGGAVEKPAAVVVPPKIADEDGDGVADKDDKCPGTPKGVKVDATGCPISNLEASVTSSPAAVKAQEKFLVGVQVNTAVKVRVAFKDDKGVVNNSNSVLVDEGNSKSEFSVPAELKSGKYKLIVTFEDMVTHAKKVEEKDIVIVENVSASLPGSFAPGQPPTMQNVKVNGLEKLEGVTYTIDGFDKDKKSIGTLDSNSVAKGDKSWTLEDKKGTRIPLTAPGTKGFQKEVNYVVTLKNKEGHVVWTGSFEVGVAQTYTKKVKPK